jgi:hypothetical protein
MIHKSCFQLTTIALLAVPASLIGGQTAVPALFKEVKTDVRQIHASAIQLEKLVSRPDSQWIQYDKQWNEIKPAQEALELHLRALQGQEKSMSPADRKAVEDSKTAVQEIAARTHQVRLFLDQPGVDLRSPELDHYVRDLATETVYVARMMPSPTTTPAMH